ncbi:endonuclease [Pedobacter sp. Leaf41]|uniref:endonuclease n=1 Tax=Pedobacter sp. Leaf41 TaxID=1736218 RepID=UPI000703423B|nr:endonuclease [Pedobacter sp. Leaf41]KQN38773.1 endonuclease [Pedobacter sp. Leaf41]
MPEGPSIVILKDLVAGLRLRKPEVLEVTGNVTTIDKNRLLHRKVNDFKSWGKHFLICFDDFTVRIHFMLFGTYLINDSKKTPIKLGLTFKNDQLNFYTCKIDLLEGDINQHYDWKSDVMSTSWDPKLALKKLKETASSYICDVLLDQKIFGGVGNIIKNEVLYRTKVHPLSKIEDIPLAKLKEIISESQRYSFDFLAWKKENTLSKRWEVYLQKKCAADHEVTKQELGKTHRQCYVCDFCQRNYSKK